MNTLTDTLRPTVADSFDVVDLSSDDSFPCSDPPSWTPVTGTGAGHD